MDGTITAGIYHELDITIPANPSNSTGFNPADPTVNTDNSPYVSFSNQYDGTFVAGGANGFVDANFSATVQPVMNSGVVNSPNSVGAWALGTTFAQDGTTVTQNDDPLYASGGSVTVTATLAQGSGSITAYGGPTITITNNSPDYLLIGDIEIPDIPGGYVTETSPVSGIPIDLSGIAIDSVNPGQKPAVTIDQAYGSSVGDSSYGPALFLTGNVENPGGTVTITNTMGSYGQLGTIDAQSVTLDIAYGVAAIDTPNEPYNLQSEEAQWEADMIWPGGDPYSTTSTSAPQPSATAAISYVVNSMYNSSGSLTEAQLNTDLYSYVGDTGSAGSTVPTSIVFIGDSFPYVDGSGYGESQNSTWTTEAGNSSSTPYTFNTMNPTSEAAYFPEIPLETLSTTVDAPTSTSTAPTTPTASIMGGGFAIDAESIDINGELDVGTPTPNWSVTLGPTAASDISVYQQEYDEGQETDPDYSLPLVDLSTVNPGDDQITATYSAVTKQITIDNVVAGLHGGFGTLDGKIISTNPQGSINFKDGLGNVSINNQTGIPIVVQTIDTGSPASSTLDITDTDKFGSQEQTLYVYQPGSPIQEYTGQAGVTLGSGTPSATVSGTSASYDPEAGARWTWEDTASLYRTQTTLFSSEDVPTLAYNGDTSTLPSDWLSAWGWGTPGNPNTNQNPWTVSNAGVSTTSGISDDTALSETISGTVPAGTLPTSIPSYTSQPPVTSYNENSSVASWTPFEYNNNFGFNNFGSGTSHKNWWNYYWPLQASLTLTNSVKADYPIAIDFSGASASGTVNITSNAPVYLAGTITQDVGQTSITAQGSITQASGASIEAKNLTLTAADGIGSTSQPLVVNLAAGGVLNAQSGNAGVYLNLNSGQHRPDHLGRRRGRLRRRGYHGQRRPASGIRPGRGDRQRHRR